MVSNFGQQSARTGPHRAIPERDGSRQVVIQEAVGPDQRGLPDALDAAAPALGRAADTGIDGELAPDIGRDIPAPGIIPGRPVQ